jgi:hypothetical protein
MYNYVKQKKFFLKLQTFLTLNYRSNLKSAGKTKRSVLSYETSAPSTVSSPSSCKEEKKREKETFFGWFQRNKQTKREKELLFKEEDDDETCESETETEAERETERKKQKVESEKSKTSKQGEKKE